MKTARSLCMGVTLACVAVVMRLLMLMARFFAVSTFEPAAKGLWGNVEAGGLCMFAWGD